jgi:hypothetical protein
MTTTARARGFETAVTPGKGNDFDIQWMPPGAQSITCHVDDQPTAMAFTVRPEHAEQLNRMLQLLIAKALAGQGDEPYIDFDHQDGRASGRPTEMYWGGNDSQKGGIRLKGTWTGSGKAAVAGGDYKRFSPEWTFHKDTREPIGIGVNLGGLVNRAAFQGIQAVAKGASADELLRKGAESVAKHFGKQFVAKAKAISAEQNISYAEAIARLARQDPTAYAQYRRVTVLVTPAPAQRRVGNPEHQFIQRATAYGRARGIASESEAMTAYARTDEGRHLYQQFRRKCHVSQKVAMASTPLATPEEIAAVESGGDDHEFVSSTMDLINGQGLAPMTAAKVIAKRDPALYADYFNTMQNQGKAMKFHLGQPENL